MVVVAPFKDLYNHNFVVVCAISEDPPEKGAVPRFNKVEILVALL